MSTIDEDYGYEPDDDYYDYEPDIDFGYEVESALGSAGMGTDEWYGSAADVL